ncbi:MAG TPA: amidohydrolase family protein [Actinopolymorphaceae bacterium]
MTVDLFDVDAMVGPVATTADVAEDVSALLTRMDRLRIAETIVVHTHAWRHDVAAGNRLAVEQVDGHERLHPGWVVLPDTCGEVPPPAEFVGAAVRHGVAAFRACPVDHGYDLLGPDMAGALTELEAYGRPLLLDSDQVPWPQVDVLAGRHPRLAVVVTHTGYRTVRPMAGVLARHDNVYVDLSYLGTHQVLEWLVERFGPGRVLFGTGQPHRDPADAVARLLWSDLDDDAVAAIGAGNLRRLVTGGVPA